MVDNFSREDVCLNLLNNDHYITTSRRAEQVLALNWTFPPPALEGGAAGAGREETAVFRGVDEEEIPVAEEKLVPTE